MMLIMTKRSKKKERRNKMMSRLRTIMMRIRQLDDDFKKADFSYRVPICIEATRLYLH